MNLITLLTQAQPGQRPGTSGLRKKVRVFQEPGCVYLEHFEPHPARHGGETRAALAPLIAAAEALAGITRRTGRSRSTVMT